MPFPLHYQMNKKIVVINSLHSSRQALIQRFSESFSILGLNTTFEKARSVFLKPNLTYPRFKPGVTTRVEFVEALVDALRKINSTTTIYIGEGEGGYNSFSMNEAFLNMGFFKLEQKYPNVKVINLSELPTVDVEFSARNRPYVLRMPELFFNEIDFSITCPVPKIHCMTRVTLAFKNQWGCLPDVMRLKNHFVFDEIIGQISERLKFKYAFLDGKYGLDENGPMDGTLVEPNWFVASNSLGAFDMTVAKLMGIDWKVVNHIRAAKRHGLIPEDSEIEIVGEIDSMKRKFSLKRTFWNYPALCAFNSSYLTHLVYFSSWAKPLHDIMYTFRKKPIQ